MNINLDNIIPAPLIDTWQPSQVWGSQLNLQQGNCYQVLAASGRGKSTLLHILSGLRQDYSGTYTLGGQNAFDMAKNNHFCQVRRRMLSLVFQDLRLLPQLTARQNITILNPESTDYLAELEQLATTLGVFKLLDQPCGKLSRGQNQRVAIISALLRPFDWLLADEPFSHLDPDTRQSCITIINKKLMQKNAGLLITGLEPDTWFNYEQVLAL